MHFFTHFDRVFTVHYWSACSGCYLSLGFANVTFPGALKVWQSWLMRLQFNWQSWHVQVRGQTHRTFPISRTPMGPVAICYFCILPACPFSFHSGYTVPHRSERLYNTLKEDRTVFVQRQTALSQWDGTCGSLISKKRVFRVRLRHQLFWFSAQKKEPHYWVKLENVLAGYSSHISWKLRRQTDDTSLGVDL